MNQVEIYTDGACKGNPGPGGWGAWLRSGSTEKELFGGELGTTNNRMELMAVIEALSALKRPCAVTLYLDSEYVRKGITEWIHGWKAKGWKTAIQATSGPMHWPTGVSKKPWGVGDGGRLSVRSVCAPRHQKPPPGLFLSLQHVKPA